MLSNEFFLSQNTPKSMSAGASPLPPNWFQGGRFAAGGEQKEGLGEREGMGNGEWRREGKRGNLGENSALVVGV